LTKSYVVLGQTGRDKSSNVTFLSRMIPLSLWVRNLKMGWNPRINLVHHGFGSNWIEIFL